MRIFLTGSSGYVGAVAREYLERAGHRVTALDTCLFDGCNLGRSPSEPEIRGDVRDVREEDLDGHDAVVHLAALSNDPLGDLDPALTFGINHDATIRLARLARLRGVTRFVFASSCSMYGTSGAAAAPLDETAPLAPLTAYAESKVRSERDLVALADDDFSPVFLRFATAYGVSPRLRLDVVLNNLVGWGVTTGSIRLQSDGSAWRPLIHVEDMARAICASLDAPRELVHAEAFNAGRNDANYRIRDLALLVGEVVEDAEIVFAEGAGTDPRSYRVDFSKIADTLPAFGPAWNARAGARELADAYRDADLDQSIFSDDRFIRLARIRTLEADGRLDAALRWVDERARISV
jgi:nucleoside-diphosphate-sugar epimerase